MANRVICISKIIMFQHPYANKRQNGLLNTITSKIIHWDFRTSCTKVYFFLLLHGFNALGKCRHSVKERALVEVPEARHQQTGNRDKEQS